jgi:hypothetical protein
MKKDLCVLRVVDKLMSDHITEIQLLNLHSEDWINTTLNDSFYISENNISILKEVRNTPAVRCSY